MMILSDLIASKEYQKGQIQELHHDFIDKDTIYGIN